MNLDPTKKAALCDVCKKRKNYFCTVHGDSVRRVIKNRETCKGWGNVLKVVTPDVRRMNVAVIVTCHNYGRFLAECLESVLGQSHAATEVVVVDDASTDNTKQVTESFNSVKYLRVNNHNSHFSRRDGVINTTAEIVLFVDADDTLPSDFIENGIQKFTDKTVGVVYADHLHFGESNRRNKYPEYSQDRFFRGPNFVSTCSLVRREALLISNAWDRPYDASHLPCDYWLFQHVSLDGWHFKKQISVLNYRRHSTQMSQTRQSVDARAAYYLRQGLQAQTVTLFIPLGGRKWGWNRLSDYLDRQTWPHDQIKLILCDTSQDAEFSQMVRDWIADSNYSDIRHFKMNAGVQGLADKDRRDKENQQGVKYAVSRIYNQLRLMLETPYCWILEDDIVPPENVLDRLMMSFEYNVGAVTAPYQSRFSGKPVVWDSNNHHVKPQENGVSEVGGSGFGCLVTRSELIKKHLWPIQLPKQNLDPYFFDAIRADENHWRVLCDWSCKAEHWAEDRVFLIEDKTDANSTL